MSYRKTTKKRKVSYRNQPAQVRSWGIYDVLFLQIFLCVILAGAVWLDWGQLRLWLGEALRGEKIQVSETDLTQAQEAIETFLNQYIYEEPLPQGGQFEAEKSEGTPEGMTFQKVTATETLTAPVSGVITSDFGWREHPITGKSDFHTGIDIAAAEGTAIHAAADGTVSEAGWSDVYGNYLVIDHSATFSTKYAHCSRLIAQEGDVLRKGERIAQVGSTGVSTGPHLHFETIVFGLRADPMWVLPC